MVRIRRHGPVAVLVADNPPVNALVPRLRRRLLGAIDAVEADPDVTAVVLCGENGLFPRHVNLNEFDNGLNDPDPGTLADRIETCAKPVVAMLSGPVLAAGAEIAIAAHWRVCAPDTQFAFPDIAIGLPPAAGATQRLVRILGVRDSMRLLMLGRLVPLTSETVRGLVDETAPAETLEQVAVAAARRLAENGSWKRTRDRTDGLADPTANMEEIDRRRAALEGRDRPAEKAIVDAIEAALLLPFEAGQVLERDLFDEIVQTDQARGMRYAFSAETRLSHYPQVPPVTMVGIYRTGPGAVRLCADLISNGISVVLAEPDAGARKRFDAAIRANMDARARHGLMRADAATKALESVISVEREEALAPAEVIFSTAPDTADAHRTALAAICRVARPKVALAGMTHHLDLAALAPVGQGGRVFGLHLPNRPFVARLAELAQHPDSHPEALGRVAAVLRQMGRFPVRVAPDDGLVGPALAGAMLDAADVMVRLGADPLAIDAVLRAHGFARGPYMLLSDMDGDAFAARQERRGKGRGLSALMARAGLGLGTGRDPDIEAAALGSLLREAREGRPPSETPWTSAEIWAGILGALVNQGAWLMERGVASRPFVIDTVMVQGYGFPRNLGGPMRGADLFGLFRLVTAMRKLARFDADLWEPHPLLIDFQRNGTALTSLNDRQEGTLPEG